MTATDIAALESLLAQPQDAYQTHHVMRQAPALMREVRHLQRLNEHLADRCAAAAEVLGKIANKTKLTCPSCSREWIPS